MEKRNVLYNPTANTLRPEQSGDGGFECVCARCWEDMYTFPSFFLFSFESFSNNLSGGIWPAKPRLRSLEPDVHRIVVQQTTAVV